MRRKDILYTLAVINALGCSTMMAAEVADINASNPSTDMQIQQLAEKIDQLTSSANELYAQNLHIEPRVHNILQGDLSNLFLTADFLYWQADEDRLEYALLLQGLSTEHISEKYSGLNFEWNPGFRIGIGGAFCEWNHWGILLNYTHIRNKAHGSTKAGALSTNDPLIPVWDQLLFGIYTRGAHVHWSVVYNVESIEAYKDCFVGKNLILKPHMGLINANIDQEYHADYDLFPAIAASLSKSKMHAKCNYWGLGLLGGTDMFWHFTSHFGVYGELSAGLLYGKFDIRRDGNSAFPTDTDVPDLFTSHFKKKIWRTRATVQAALGIEWETVFNSNCNRLAISLGYEFNEWFRQNQFFKSTLQARQDVTTVTGELLNADLAFKGGTLRATYDF